VTSLAKIPGTALLVLLGLQGSAWAQRAVAFDLGAARRVDDLAVSSKEAPGLEGVRMVEIGFTSRQWDSRGRATDIRIHGYLALPPGGAARRPAVIALHGLGGQVDAQHVAGIARNSDVVALGISAPGSGQSGGAGPTFDDARPVFTAAPDPRGSWIYAYAYACMRGLTLLAARPEVDPAALVLTGVSMGGVASFIVGGTDDRVRGILPVSSSGGFAQAVERGSWLRRLVLSSRGLKPSDPGPRSLFRRLDPMIYARTQKGVVYMLSGAQDEFFPLDQLLATYAAVRARRKSLAVIPDYDHQWYFGFGCPAACMPGARPPAEPAAEPCPASCPAACPAGKQPPYCGPEDSYNRQGEFIARWSLLLRALVAEIAPGPGRAVAPAPPPPAVTRDRHKVVVRPAAGSAPKAVRLAFSDNGGHTFGQVALSADPDGAYRLWKALPSTAIVIAEVETADGAVSTSVPVLPRGFRPRIRPFAPHP
jgi:dienelactone hydrolase